MSVSTILFLALLFGQNVVIGKKIYPIKFKENIELRSHHVIETYRLNNDEYILITKNPDISIGYQLIYLDCSSEEGRCKTKFTSEKQGEIYVYQVHFYQFREGKYIIIAEKGFEYSLGIDIFLLEGNECSFIGEIPVSDSDRSSVIDQTSIVNTEDEYELHFKGEIEYPVLSDEILDGKKVRVKFGKGKLNTEI